MDFCPLTEKLEVVFWHQKFGTHLSYCKSINFRGVLFFAVFYGNKNPRKLVPRK